MYTGIGPTNNTVAIVTLNGLQCGVTYNIIAGGTLNGELVGPRSPHGTITAGPCSPTITHSANICKDPK